MNREKIIPVYIEDKMKTSYLDYSMSVIVGRALPDVRDGLKPVHRRILYAMNELGMEHSKSYKKSARVVGEVIGKYHPHGDVAVYDTIVRLVQNFSLRYPLIEGQGNFGSVDGDAPAAMRYTEVKMMSICEEMLCDIDKETVEFVNNFDDTLQEPTILPTAIPNLLINGSSGIAVGMATNIPAHNLGEVIDGLISCIDNPDISIDDLIKIIKGPDFPTGAFICGVEGIVTAYKTGRGVIVLKSKASIEKIKGDKENIIITEIPYQVNKSNLIEKIADLVREKKVEGISDIRDESDREGMRIVIEIKKGIISEVILNQLYKHTQLQTSFGIIMLCLVKNQARVLNLKEMLVYFIEYRKEIIIKRTFFELNKAEKRAHILEGLKIALNNIEEVVKIIKTSQDTNQAKQKLNERFNLSEIQVQSILDMRLQRLVSLERSKLEEEYLGLLKEIEKLKFILENEKKVFVIMKEEFLEIKTKYADERRTEIVKSEADLNIEDLIAEEDVVITISHTGYIKRVPLTTYRQQKRGGKGVLSMETKEEDFVEHLFIASTHHYILFFTNKGRCYWLKVYEIPQVSRIAKGKAIINLIKISSEEKIKAFIPIKEFDDKHFLIMATKKGIVKKTNLIEYSRPRSNGIDAILLKEEDELVESVLTNGSQDIILGTSLGQAIRFNESNVRIVSRKSQGVIGTRLHSGDFVIGMIVVKREAGLLVISTNGYGKRSALSEYRTIGRGGKGVMTLRLNEKIGQVAKILEVIEGDEFMIVTSKGILIRLSVKEIRTISRVTQGVRIIKLGTDDCVIDVTRLVITEKMEESSEKIEEFIEESNDL
ncbi:MAG: DNA gyrase subunit A [bacterium]